ncbi:MAG TPA: Gfo/Idh/MocA family oxidoreductase [Firmicutes bacterium]|nr:Gfo/Idh/MocA family oxidoreductase [Bacillota bacterium]
MEKVRWGILGTASIARRHAIPAIKLVPFAEVAAIASRDGSKAAAMAQEFGIPRAFAGYDELLAKADIDAVYIPLPNDMHLTWIEKAAAAGKHVLCEKPLGLNAEEVRRVMEIARKTGRYIVEGVTSYFNPLHRRVAELIAEGRIGEVRSIHINLGWSFRDKPGDFRWRKEQGGGALLDIGGYCVSTARRLAGAEPGWVSAAALFHPEHGVDTDMAMLLAFVNGVRAVIDFSLFSAYRNEYSVVGTTGRIKVENPFGNGAGTRRILLTDIGGAPALEEEVTAYQMKEQFATVSRCFLQGEAPSPTLEESLANAMVLDACLQSAAADGAKVTLTGKMA